MGATVILAVLLTVAAVLIVAGLVAVLVTTRRRRRADQRLGDLVTQLVTDMGAGGTELGWVTRRDQLLDVAERAVARALSERGHDATVLARLAETLSAVPEGIVVCDEHGQVCYRNDTGADFAQAHHGEALAEQVVTELLASALDQGPAEQMLELYGPPRRTLLVTARPLGEAEVIGAVAIIEDISERRRLDAVRRDFVANVSHELKTPVGALGILAETMQAEDDVEVSRRLAERMHLEAFRVARIIDDLLDLSRIESEEAPIRDPVSVDQVIAEAVERMRPLAEHRRIRIDTGESLKRLSVLGDRRQLVSALHNLLENGVNYSDEGSTVQVRARVVADAAAPGGMWVEMSVRDRGIGIPTRDLERIFERFYRVDRARSRDTGGTGLGLAIVRHVVTNHRGKVTVSSREGQGSTFALRLPAGPGPVALSEAGEAAGAASALDAAVSAEAAEAG